MYGNMTLREREGQKKKQNNPLRTEKETKRSSRKIEKYTRSKYDGKGCLKDSGKDLCDCLEEACPGCWMNCPTCGSNKCGPECRVYRRYTYNEVEIEGTSVTVRNNSTDTL